MKQVKKIDTLHVFILSGSSGQRGIDATRTVLEQFSSQKVELKVYPLIGKRNGSEDIGDGLKEITNILHDAKREGAVVFHTFVVKKLAEHTNRLAAELGVRCVDYFSAPLKMLSEVTGLDPLQKPGHIHDPRHGIIMNALEFAKAHEDGVNLSGLRHAHVVIVGVSRAGKTAAALVTAMMYGLRVGNVPFVPPDLPPELNNLPGECVVVFLDTSLQRIVEHRRARLRDDLGQEPTGLEEYIDPDKVKEEIARLRRLVSSHPTWVRISITGQSVETIATRIMREYQARHPLPFG